MEHPTGMTEAVQLASERDMRDAQKAAAEEPVLALARLAAAPMDHELVVAVAKGLIHAAGDLLELDDEPQEHCGAALDGIAEAIGSALIDVLQWARPPAEHDAETTRLIALLAEWLP